MGTGAADERNGVDWLRLASSAPGLLAFLGLVIYGVVRVGHDAFYGTFGVTPETAGLSQTNILTRAALYFVFFLSASIALIGLSVAIARGVAFLETAGHSRLRDNPDASQTFRDRVDVGLLLVSSLLGLAAAIVAGLKVAWWPLAVATGVVLVLAVSAVFARRRPRGRRVLTGLLFGFLAAWSAAVAYFIAVRGNEATERGAESIEPLFRWLLFGFCFLAAATASASLLRQFETRWSGDGKGGTDFARRQISLATLSLLTVLPLAVAFLAPGVGKFVTAENNRMAAAAAILAALFSIVVVASRLLRGREGYERTFIVDALFVISLASLIAAAALFLARERGLDLASQVLRGDRVTSTKLGLFSVRADIVCLESSNGNDFRAPYIYLGQSTNNLVLYDIERRERNRIRKEKEKEFGIKAGGATPTQLPVLLAADSVKRIRVADLLRAGDAVVPTRVTMRITNPETNEITRRVIFENGIWACLGA
jgi:hypothetical protein